MLGALCGIILYRAALTPWKRFLIVQFLRLLSRVCFSRADCGDHMLACFKTSPRDLSALTPQPASLTPAAADKRMTLVLQKAWCKEVGGTVETGEVLESPALTRGWSVLSDSCEAGWVGLWAQEWGRMGYLGAACRLSWVFLQDQECPMYESELPAPSTGPGPAHMFVE